MSDAKIVYDKFPSEFPLPFILDGATGTSLMRDGMPRGCCTEKWVCENPEVLNKIQQAYKIAGSDAVLTPTFGANGMALKRHGINSDVTKLNKKLANISRSVGTHFTGGDMSPAGVFIYPYGDELFDDIVNLYKEQVIGLESAEVDFYCVETNINLAEVRAAVTAIRELSNKPVFVTMTVDIKGRTLAGDTLEASLLTLSELGINAFGANCSVGIDDMLKVLKPLVPYSVALGIPLIAKPNAGMPHEDSDGNTYFDCSADEFGKYADEFLNSGILILGGCCGTDENYIARLREAADKFSYIHSDMEIPDVSKLACTNRRVEEPEHESLITISSIEEAIECLEDAYYDPDTIEITGDAGAVSYFKRYYNGKVLISEEK